MISRDKDSCQQFFYQKRNSVSKWELSLTVYVSYRKQNFKDPLNTVMGTSVLSKPILCQN